MICFLFMGQNFVIKNLFIINPLRTPALLYFYLFFIFLQLHLSDAALPKFSRKVSFSAENMFFYGIFLRNILLQCPRHNFPDAAPEGLFPKHWNKRKHRYEIYKQNIHQTEQERCCYIFVAVLLIFCVQNTLRSLIIHLFECHGTNYLEFTKSSRFTVKLTIFDSNLAILRKCSRQTGFSDSFGAG